MKLGFIGAGQMAAAIASGIAKSDSNFQFYAFDPNPAAVELFQRGLGISSFESCHSNLEVVEQSDYVFIAVKPQFASVALDGLKNNCGNTLFISVVAGLSTVQLQRFLASDQVIRVMPNTPCLVGAGAIAISASDVVSAVQLQNVYGMLEKVGTVVEVPESQLNAVTGLSGSGPAFVFTFVEAMIDGGVLAGLPRSVSKQLAMQTIKGSLELLTVTEQHPASLRDQVTSPGGTTIHGMEQLEKNGFRDSVHSAINAATQRAAELS